MRKIILLSCCLFHLFSAISQTKTSYESLLNDFESGNYRLVTKQSPQLLTTLSNSDSLYREVCSYNAYAWFAQKNYDSAIVYGQQEYDLRKKYEGEHSENLPNTAYFLAIYYSYAAKYAPAVLLMREAQEYRVATYGKSAINSIHMTNQLANLYHLAGSTYDAEQLYEANYKLVKENYKDSDSISQVMINAISAFYTTSGNYDKSEPFFFMALEMLEKYYSKKSDQYLASFNSLGEFYIYAGNYQKAIATYKDFVVLCGDFYGKKSADYATALNNLAVSYEKNENYLEAEKIYLQCLAIKEKVYTKKSDYYALTLVNLGVVYDYLGKFKEAEKVLEEAVNIYETVYGGNNENYATALSNIASVYSSNGNYQKAINYFDKSMSISESLYGKNSLNYINALNNKAQTNIQLGNYLLAEQLLKEAVELRKQVQGKNHPDLGVALNNYANVLSILGKHAEALQVLKESMRVLEKASGKNSIAYANALQTYAALLAQQGFYAQAKTAYKECDAYYFNQLGPMHPEYAIYLNNVGQFYFELGEYQEANAYYEKALVIQDAAYGKEHASTFALLSNIGNLRVAQGKFQEAENCFLTAEKIIATTYGKEHPDYATICNNLAVMYYEMGNYKKAEELYLQSTQLKLKIYGKDHLEYSTALNNLGSNYLAMATQTEDANAYSDYLAKAIDNFKRALSIDSSKNNQHPNLAAHYNNLAEAYRLSNMPEKAIDLYEASIALEKTIYGDDKPSLAKTYHNVALLYAGMEKANLAEQFALKAYSIFTKTFGENCEASVSVVSSLAFINEQKNNYDSAYFWYEKSRLIHREVLERNFEFLSENERMEYLNSVRLYRDMFATFVEKNKSQHPELIKELFEDESTLKGLLLRSNTALKNQLLASKNAESKIDYYRWISTKEIYARQLQLPENSRSYKIDSLQQEIQTVEKKLIVAYGKNAVKSIHYVDANAISSKLKSDELAIEFIRFMYNDASKENVYYALLLRPNAKEPEMIRVCTESNLLEILNDNPGNNFNYVTSVYGTRNKSNHKLYETLWQPLKKQVSGAKTIYYSPVGLINKIALHAISDSSSKYLSENYQLIQLGSLATFHEISSTTLETKQSNALLVGGVDYGDKGVWNYLSGTLSETQKIKSLVQPSFANTTFLSGKMADEKQIKQSITNTHPSLIHFATHGFFFQNDAQRKPKKAELSTIEFRGNSNAFLSNSQDPLFRSGLVFSGANNSASIDTTNLEDGLLTAYELGLLNLSKTELMVLSACETGLGDIKGSEGVFGLQRGIKMAGAKKIIMSLWQVPDKETDEFMNQFYSLLMKTKNIRDSFIETQRFMQKKYDPYFWAAFILVE